MRYTVEETYIYQVEADTPEEAVDDFHQYAQANTSEAEDETGVVFLQNTLTVHDTSGKEV